MADYRIRTTKTLFNDWSAELFLYGGKMGDAEATAFADDEQTAMESVISAYFGLFSSEPYNE